MSHTILGIDPGLSHTGYGIIIKERLNMRLVAFGCIRTQAGENFSKRLGNIVKEFQKFLKRHKPNAVAVESLFFYKNISSALKVGQAKGAVLACCASHHIPVHEFTPLQIKMSVTGYGKADKNQIQQMVKMLLGLKEIPKPSHAADALAVALCCAQHMSQHASLKK